MELMERAIRRMDNALLYKSAAAWDAWRERYEERKEFELELKRVTARMIRYRLYLRFTHWREVIFEEAKLVATIKRSIAHWMKQSLAAAWQKWRDIATDVKDYRMEMMRAVLSKWNPGTLSSCIEAWITNMEEQIREQSAFVLGFRHYINVYVTTMWHVWRTGSWMSNLFGRRHSALQNPLPSLARARATLNSSGSGYAGILHMKNYTFRVQSTLLAGIMARSGSQQQARAMRLWSESILEQRYREEYLDKAKSDSYGKAASMMNVNSMAALAASFTTLRAYANVQALKLATRIKSFDAHISAFVRHTRRIVLQFGFRRWLGWTWLDRFITLEEQYGISQDQLSEMEIEVQRLKHDNLVLETSVASNDLDLSHDVQQTTWQVKQLLEENSQLIEEVEVLKERLHINHSQEFSSSQRTVTDRRTFDSRSSSLSNPTGLSGSLLSVRTSSPVGRRRGRSPVRGGAPTWDAVVEAASNALREKKAAASASLHSSVSSASRTRLTVSSRSSRSPVRDSPTRHERGNSSSGTAAGTKAVMKWAKTSDVELKRVPRQR